MTVAKVTGGFFDAMKSQPLALAQAIIIIALLYFVYDIRQQEMRLATEHQKQIADLFGKFCAPPP